MKAQIASTNVNAQPTSQNNSAPAANGQSALLRQLTAALGKRLAQVAQPPGSNEANLLNRKPEIVNPNPPEARTQATPARPLTTQPPEEFCDLGVPAIKSSA